MLIFVAIFAYLTDQQKQITRKKADEVSFLFCNRSFTRQVQLMHKPYTSTVDFYLLIPCYNNLSGLILSLKSVHYYPDKYGVLLVDDGSTELLKTEELRLHLPPEVPLRIIRLEYNQGITRALNAGLNWLKENASCRFIARLDCGDTCTPERFYKQVAFFDANPKIDLVGSWCTFMHLKSGFSYHYRTPTSHERLIKGMNFRNMFIHPTVMWRATALNETANYPEEFPHAEDYGFFYHMVNTGRSAVLPEALVTCEINSAGLSLRFRNAQLKSRMKVVKQYGKSNVYRFAGVMKLMLLIAIPSRIALLTKHLLFAK